MFTLLASAMYPTEKVSQQHIAKDKLLIWKIRLFKDNSEINLWTATSTDFHSDNYRFGCMLKFI